jgi:hypothetical protein
MLSKKTATTAELAIFNGEPIILACIVFYITNG